MSRLVAVLLILHAAQYSMSSNNTDGCKCAVMPSEDASTPPLIDHSLNIDIPCDEGGADTCRKLCVALAEATRADEKGPEILCEQIKTDIKNLKVHLFYNACKQGYYFTGLKYLKNICCRQGKVIDCGQDEVFL